MKILPDDEACFRRNEVYAARRQIVDEASCSSDHMMEDRRDVDQRISDWMIRHTDSRITQELTDQGFPALHQEGRVNAPGKQRVASHRRWQVSQRAGAPAPDDINTAWARTWVPELGPPIDMLRESSSVSAGLNFI
jgi:hypothetical protein